MPRFIRRAKYEIERALNATMSEHAIINMAGAVISGIMQPQLQVDKEASCSLLLGIRTSNGLSLWENGSQGVVFAPIDSKAQCIGCGRGLGLYFADWLFKEHMPANYTRTIAAHLLKQTKEYVPDCGGESHILMIPFIGKPAFIDEATLTELERQLGNIEAAMRKVLVFSPGVPGVDINTETLEERTKALVAAVDAARGLYVRLTGEAATGSIGSMSTSALTLEGQRPTPSIAQTSGSTSSPTDAESVRITEQMSAERIETPSHRDKPEDA
jgi:hypothetical protein